MQLPAGPLVLRLRRLEQVVEAIEPKRLADDDEDLRDSGGIATYVARDTGNIRRYSQIAWRGELAGQRRFEPGIHKHLHALGADRRAAGSPGDVEGARQRLECLAVGCDDGVESFEIGRT